MEQLLSHTIDSLKSGNQGLLEIAKSHNYSLSRMKRVDAMCLRHMMSSNSVYPLTISCDPRATQIIQGMRSTKKNKGNNGNGRK